MSLCIRPCLVFSVFLLVVAVVFMVFLGDITNWKGAQYDFLNVGVQLGSFLFGLTCLVVHLLMLRSNGFFVCCSSNKYLFIILSTLLIFSCFTVAFMISNVWAQQRWLNLGLFLALDTLQCAFVGLSLFAQKTRYDEFVLRTMQLNTKNGNPIDARTAARLYRLKYSRTNGNCPMFDETEVERLNTYLIPKDDDIKELNRADSANTSNKNDGYYYCATAMAV